jgi:uncharacterized membrane protein YvlD (DUF360 family)
MEFKVDITQITMAVFEVVVTAAVFNFALFLLGFVAISFSTFIGSALIIGLLQWLMYTALQGLDLQFEITDAPSEDAPENPEDKKDEH